MSEIYNISAQEVANTLARARSEQGAALLLGISETEVERRKACQQFWYAYHIARRQQIRKDRLLELASQKQRAQL